MGPRRDHVDLHRGRWLSLVRVDVRGVGWARLMTKPRMTTAIRFSPELHARLKEAAEDRDLSINFLVVKAVEDFLPRLADTVTLTKGTER